MEYRKIRIFLDPRIKLAFGPEVCWVWRLLLTSLGYCWLETNSHSENCDVAYSINADGLSNSKIVINADLNLWEQVASLKICDIVETEHLTYPLYQNQDSRLPVIKKNMHGTLVDRDLIFDIYYILTGQEERYWTKDKHGIFDLSGNVIFIDRVGKSALVNEMVEWLGGVFSKSSFSEPLQRWPRDKKAAACTSHDVDYPEVKRLVEPFRVIQRLGYTGFRAAIDVLIGRRTHWHFTSWVQMEKENGFRSAFYFVPVQGSILAYAFGRPDPFYDVNLLKFRKLFSYLADEGVEIGLHSSYLAYKSIDQFMLERDTLSKVTGQDISGNRHHYWHLDPDDIESTLHIHEQVGFKYDTSLTHDRYPGWRRGLSCPFFPYYQNKRRELKTLQIQTTWIDSQLLDPNVNEHAKRYEALTQMADVAARFGGCLNINVHDYVFDNVLFPGWSETYRWYLKHLSRRSDFWIAKPVEIADHWTRRYNLILRNSSGLRLGYN